MLDDRHARTQTLVAHLGEHAVDHRDIAPMRCALVQQHDGAGREIGINARAASMR